MLKGLSRSVQKRKLMDGNSTEGACVTDIQVEGQFSEYALNFMQNMQMCFQ